MKRTSAELRTRLVDALDLARLPQEGGWFRQTSNSGDRSTILFLLAGDDFSALHRLDAVEDYRYVAGAALRLLLLDKAGPREEIVSRSHQHVTVPAGCWQGSSSASDWTLVTTSVTPAFDWSLFELGEREQLQTAWPAAARRIAALTRPVPA